MEKKLLKEKSKMLTYINCAKNEGDRTVYEVQSILTKAYVFRKKRLEGTVREASIQNYKLLSLRGYLNE